MSDLSSSIPTICDELKNDYLRSLTQHLMMKNHEFQTFLNSVPAFSFDEYENEVGMKVRKIKLDRTLFGNVKEISKLVENSISSFRLSNIVTTMYELMNYLKKTISRTPLRIILDELIISKPTILDEVGIVEKTLNLKHEQNCLVLYYKEFISAYTGLWQSFYRDVTEVVPQIMQSAVDRCVLRNDEGGFTEDDTHRIQKIISVLAKSCIMPEINLRKMEVYRLFRQKKLLIYLNLKIYDKNSGSTEGLDLLKANAEIIFDQNVQKVSEELASSLCIWLSDLIVKLPDGQGQNSSEDRAVKCELVNDLLNESVEQVQDLLADINLLLLPELEKLQRLPELLNYLSYDVYIELNKKFIKDVGKIMSMVKVRLSSSFKRGFFWVDCSGVRSSLENFGKEMLNNILPIRFLNYFNAEVYLFLSFFPLKSKQFLGQILAYKK